jgi:polyisoprenoid-binding protein YceI
MKWQAVAILTATAGLTAATSEAPTTWQVDPPHTQVQFTAKHFFTPVTGTFGDYSIKLEYDPRFPERSTVEAQIAVASINTGSTKRDDHLRSGDFFEAQSHPNITFRSTSVRSAGEGKLIAKGPLTIKGATREVELPITILGVQSIPEDMRPMMGGVREIASFKTAITVDRRDFGVGVGDWAAAMVVGKDVQIQITLEANRR